MIGLLRHRVEFKKEVKAPDGQGGWKQTWKSLGSFWAGIYPLSVKEVSMHKSILTEVDTKIIVRYNTLLEDENIVAFHNNDRYKIVGIINSASRGRFTELVAVKVIEKWD